MRRVHAVALIAAFAIVFFVWPENAQAARELTRRQMQSARSYAAVKTIRVDRQTRSRRFPYYAKTDRWLVTGPHVWASGYLPGKLWLGYQLNGSTWYSRRAASRQDAIADQRTTSSALDIGQRYYYSLAKAYDMTGKRYYRNVALKAAQRQAERYSPTVQAVRSHNTTETHNVIIDELMNVQLLFWGARHGGPRRWRTVAHRHALTVARDFVRPDGSTHQLVRYDPATGEVESKLTVQGHSPDSTWARGQAWAIYGFATAYRETHDARLLHKAREIADRFIADMPSDGVPYWDFEDPSIPNAPKDTSAAAIAASGLIELATEEYSKTRARSYASAARQILRSLQYGTYRSRASTIMLKRGVLNYWNPNTRQCGLSFGDYFYFEALLRLRQLPSTTRPLRVRRISASKGKPKRAYDRRLRTSWSARGRQWIQLDFRKRLYVKAVGVALKHGNSRSAGFTVRTSTNGRHWRYACRMRSSAETSELERYDFRTRRARFVRIYCNGTSRNSIVRLSEIRAY